MDAKLDIAIKDLILEALGTQYVAFCDGTETGNHYQSVALGDVKTKGFREDRGPLLDKIDFNGKKVLDLGSNLGELSRATRARGASLVDGFEFDPYFIEVANLINVFTGATRVSFFRRDISDPISYTEQYDIVLAFAVFGQGVNRCLARLSEITDVLIFETHKLEGTFDAQYVRPVSKFFPHYRILGQSDWGSVDRREVRAVAAFAKDEETLSSVLRPPDVPSPNGGSAGGVRRGRVDTGPPSRDICVDVERTALHSTFFSHYAFDSAEDLLAAVDTTEIDLASLLRSHDGRRRNYHGWVSWFVYLKGYCQYCKSKDVGPGNVYYDYVVEHHQFDPVVSSQLESPDKTVEYVTRQFRDMDACRYRESDEQATERIAPIHVAVAGRPVAGVLPVFEVGRGEVLPARLVDGWHRLFAARVFEVPALRAVAIEESGAGPILGAIDQIEAKEGGLEIRGWCLDPRASLDRIGVNTDKKILSSAASLITARTDVQDLVGHIPHALDSGLDISCDCDPEQAEEILLELTAFGNWLRPLGKINIHYARRMLEELTSLPAQLARRLYGTADAGALAARSLTSMHELLAPITRFRSLHSFESVLDFGCGIGLLELSMRRFLPTAELTTVDFDDEVIEWCRTTDLAAGTFLAVPSVPPTELQSNSYELVLGSSVLPRLDRSAQAAWLEELHRVMKIEGYAALTVLGELVLPVLGERKVLDDLDRDGISDRQLANRPDWSTPLPVATYQSRDYTIELCEGWFDTIAYVEGAVANQQDLIVVRKA